MANEENALLQASSVFTMDDLYRRMVEGVEDYAIILIDRNGIIRSWNRGAEIIKQYNEEEAVGKHFRLFYLPDDARNGLPESLLRHAVSHGKAIHEGWRLRKDGSRFWGNITLTAIHDDHGHTIAFTKVTRDLTERKQSEDRLHAVTAELKSSNEALRKSEEEYHKMIEEVEDYAIILLNENGDIQNWNAGAEKIKGYTAQEIVGKNFRVFYLPSDRAAGLPEKLIRTAVDEGKANHEGWRVRKDGSTFWGSIVITAIHNNRGDVIGFSKVTRNLTDKKLAEDKLNDYLLELEKQNRELERFAYVASHDLQEPLRKIRTFTELIEGKQDDPEARGKYFGKIKESAARMSELIKSILQYSRLSETAAEYVPVHLDKIMQEVLHEYEFAIQEKGAFVTTTTLPVIQGNPIQISQLFANLVANALKFTTTNPMIQVTGSLVAAHELRRFGWTTKSSRYHQVIFSDNGIGFSETYREKIFVLFERLHSRHEYPGTGIGLALCKRIMENHQGFIRAEGIPGQGAAFYLYFPVQPIV